MKRADSILFTLFLLAFGVWWFWFREGSVQLKDGVTLNGVKGPLLFALGVAKTIYGAFGADLTVTSTTDGVHPAGGANDPHYSGYAADLRIRDIATNTVQSIYKALSAALHPLGFDVVLESDHIHVEYDPKIGRTLFGLAGWRNANA